MIKMTLGSARKILAMSDTYAAVDVPYKHNGHDVVDVHYLGIDGGPAAIFKTVCGQILNDSFLVRFYHVSESIEWPRLICSRCLIETEIKKEEAEDGNSE